MKNFNWTEGSFLIGYHLALAISLPIYLIYTPLNLWLILSAFLLFVFAALGITAGYHRFYTHKTFKPHPILEVGMLFFSTLAVQGSALQWAHDHRLHHRHVDTDKDPYQTKDGFWHSHLLWMFQKRESFDPGLVSDLAKNPMVSFQDRHYIALVAVVNLVPVLLLGWAFSDFAGAFVIALLARMFLVHHCTWFINSLAHMWGVKPFSTEHSAVNNWFLALLTMGEGYHNYHHTFAGDYRNGVRFYQYDITRVLIWLASKFGLASGLRTVKDSTIRKRLVIEDRKLMLAKIDGRTEPAKTRLKREIVGISDNLVRRLGDLESIRQHLAAVKKSSRDSDLMVRLRDELKYLKRAIRRESRAWAKLCRQVAA
ncbi:MAG TPA: acyl-CoA desaturase, partial [Acidobacteriota bacterium]|nr:acyl-CoA desaturase [Acidobacteriota bacterium]